MRTMLIIACFLMPVAVGAVSPVVSRRDGFLIIWETLRRPVGTIRTDEYADVPEGSRGYDVITFAKTRGLLEDVGGFRPDESLVARDAMVWLLRTRNLTDPEEITDETLPSWLEKYPSVISEHALGSTLTVDDTKKLIGRFDQALKDEVHLISNYGAELQGEGTAFGEKFDFHAFTAAHKYLPYNTLIRVTNVSNGKSVVVRINDRGPYVEGRDLDLSASSFYTIAGKEQGIMHARIERLGDVNLVGPCTMTDRFQRPLGTMLLEPGVPHFLHLWQSISLRASAPFVVRSVRYPDGTMQSVQDWVLPGETYAFTPAVEGDYLFRIGDGRRSTRSFSMRVFRCSQS